MQFPLAGIADRTLAQLAVATNAKAIAGIDGMTLLGERAMLKGLRIPGQVAAGGGCRLFATGDDAVALNLARPADRQLLPALFETDQLNPADDCAISREIAQRDAAMLVMRGRTIGLAIAHERESLPSTLSPFRVSTPGMRAAKRGRHRPRVLDLSSLWAGPLAGHLLWLAGADVMKIESRTRPDAMRLGDPDFFALLNQGKSSVQLTLTDHADRRALLALIASADIVIESARPRALEHLGIDVAQIIRSTPGLVWLHITGHGTQGDAAQWVGFGDDCAVAGGLSAALRKATGRQGFVGDAIADPLTGMLAALIGWRAWAAFSGGGFALSMTHVIADAVNQVSAEGACEWQNTLRAWSIAVDEPFPTVARRSIGTLRTLGEDTRSCLQRCSIV